MILYNHSKMRLNRMRRTTHNAGPLLWALGAKSHTEQNSSTDQVGCTIRLYDVVVVVDPPARSGGVIVVLYDTNRLCSLNILPAGGGVQLRGGDCHKELKKGRSIGVSRRLVAVSHEAEDRLRSGSASSGNSDQTPYLRSDADDA